ncbi:MAG: hypothetical protein V4475_11885 [Pseudomonadota bacterium]
MAVFGPLANGADVQLLARPIAGELTPSALDEFSRFYYSGWRGSAERETPYWAFFRLDDDYWGLVKSGVIAKRSMGVVFVSWLALLSEAQLHEIGWRTHRLWSALPDPLQLPEPGTRLDPIAATPRETHRSSGESALADHLACSIDRGWERGEQVYLPPFPALGATPEAVLNAAWDRMGTLVAGHSYATWGGIEDHGFAPREGPFDLLTGGNPRAEGGRVAATLEEQLSAAWVDRRRREGGIDPDLEVELTEEDVEQIAEARFTELRHRLVTLLDFSAFGEIARSNPANSVAAPQVLTRTIQSLPERDAAKAIDVFVADALDKVGTHDRIGDPRDEIAFEAISRGLVFRLDPATIEKLADVLFGSDRRVGLTSQLIDALDRQLEKAGPFDWATPSAIETMISKLAPGDAQGQLRDKLLAVLGIHERAAVGLIEVYLRSAPGFVEADANYRRIRDELSAHLRPRWVTRMFGVWAERALAAITGGETETQGLAAALAILTDMREEQAALPGGLAR